jgi:uncharacterized protein (DUF1800 family)
MSPAKTERSSERAAVDPRWAWSAFEPDAERPWNLARAGHLYRRAAFGAGWSRLEQALADGPRRAIDRLLHPDADVAAFDRTYDDYEITGADSAEGLRAWWLRRMIESPHPLAEKMTLFWHGHFAISNHRVNSGALMQRHVALLRSHALGRYDALLSAVSRDPATLLGLDGEANRKSMPNANYARGLMGSYALGLGNFSETDVREAARAFTGWFVLRNELRFVAREHDDGPKTVLGRQGNFDGQDVVEIILEQPAAPRLVARKLYRRLISETEEPGDALIEPLAESFARDYDVGNLVETILRSNLFFSPWAYRRRVKSPIEFALGIVKGLEGLVPTAALGQDLAELGQNLLHAPTVNGWIGATHWINQATTLGRSNLAWALLSGAKPYGDGLNPLETARKHGRGDAEAARRFLVDLFVDGDLPADAFDALVAADARAGSLEQQLRRFAHRVVTLPEFQLS